MSNECSFCGKKFSKIILNKNGKSICQDCLVLVNELQEKKDYKIRCPSCSNPLIVFEEVIELDKVTFRWRQEEDGSLRLVDITPFSVYNREYVCGMCDEPIELDPEILECKDRILHNHRNTVSLIKEKIGSIINKTSDKSQALRSILKVLDKL